MAEELRSIEITVRIDTNKRTSVVGIDAETFDDALDQVREHLSDERWALR